MHARQRSRVTPSVLLFALLDVVGMLILASGALWLARGQTLFIPDFPTSTPAALLTVVAGVALMLWATAQILRELIKHPDGDGADTS